MKRYCVVILACVAGFGGTVLAEVPGKINYQGKLTDLQGRLVKGQYDMTFKLYDVATGGTALWTEDHSDVQVTNGFFNVMLGKTDDITQAFQNDSLYLEITVSGDKLSPRQQMASVGYSLRTRGISVDANGNVGIGTKNPDKKLHVVTTSFDSSALFVGPGGGAGGAASIRIADTTDISSGLALFQRGSGATVGAGANGADIKNQRDGDMAFWTNNTERLRIKNTGNIGVGTKTPQDDFHIYSSYSGTRSCIQFGGYGGIGTISSSAAMLLGNNVKPAVGTVDEMQIIATHQSFGARAIKMKDEEGITFHTIDGAVTEGDPFTSERMRIDENGNVGIGTTSPETKLDVTAYNDEGDVGIKVGNTGPATGGAETVSLIFEHANYYHAAIVGTRDGTLNGCNEVKGGIEFKVNPGTCAQALSNLSTKMVIKDTGNVGIGTTSPAGKLDVNGAIYQRGSSLHADYVFEPGYGLESIEEHEAFMWENRHLKAIPKARVDEEGKEIIEVGSHRRGIVEELEKAHIYIAELNREIKELKEKIK